MRFEVQPGVEVLDISVIYRPQEYSFGVEQRHGALPPAFTSVQVNELQLQLDEQGRVLYADGYCPHVGWSETQATPPSAHRATLFVKDVDFVAGVSVALSTSRWTVSVNRSMGWVCVGEQRSSASCSAVEFASGSIAVVDGGSLKAIWLKPTVLPS
jgi:hypothetical protein